MEGKEDGQDYFQSLKKLLKHIHAPTHRLTANTCKIYSSPQIITEFLITNSSKWRWQLGLSVLNKYKSAT